ncbi:hypothetical protein T4B_6561 [Trichinella pseudospiralis]|uniref:Uncharacterized protein n=1 Tax=Trichinella pseudospiralis TaxID=6337 RepID=A0A0V1IWP5_TRIPS|nr:hypothetical protein T4A_1339 [Trichinella pseudospiralis]KRZ27183.1 hypothetical protein T4B_6561 [Trichinella pseudospiralis]
MRRNNNGLCVKNAKLALLYLSPKDYLTRSQQSYDNVNAVGYPATPVVSRILWTSETARFRGLPNNNKHEKLIRFDHFAGTCEGWASFLSGLPKYGT